ncbi:MAG: nucleotidyltransferase domain-containing protein [Nanoarchaeota archaeon]
MATKRLKKTKLLELNEAYLKMMYWFFSFPDREIGLNDLSEALRISKTTAKKVVLQLVDEGFLNREILGKIWRISCNHEHHYNYTRKICYNLTLIYESVILNAIHDLIRNPKAVVLFGSYRKGDDNERSDIDIAVEVVGDEDVKLVELGVIPEFGHRKNVLVNLYVFSRNKTDLNLFSNIANGIVIEGFLEARP